MEVGIAWILHWIAADCKHRAQAQTSPRVTRSCYDGSATSAESTRGTKFAEEGNRRVGVLQRIAEQIAALERAHPVRVGIDGPSATGKTTLADELIAPLALLSRPVIRASVDDFHRPASERYARGRESPEGYFLDTFDYPALRASLLLPLGPGGSCRYRTAVFDSWTDLPIDLPACEAPRDAILLFDGVFLFRAELNDCWDFRIYVDTDADETLRRGISRDQCCMGSKAVAERRYLVRYVPGERMYVESIHPRQQADATVENTDPTHPKLARGKALA